jgi:hypothetical protein
MCSLMYCCKTKKFKLMLLSKMFQKLCIFLLFLCPGTILVPSCRTSCQASSSPPPPLSGFIRAASSHPFSRSMTAPTLRTLLLYHPSRVPGRGYRRQPPQSLHGCRCHAWQPASPWQTTSFAPGWSCRNQAGLVLRPTGLYTFLSGAAMRRSRNRYPTQRGGFSMPKTSGIITGATDAVPIPSTGTATEVGPLTSSPPSQGQSSGGALWTPAYTPGDGQTSWVYFNNPVLHLYISCYITVNNPVLCYPSLRLLPQYPTLTAY